jgi:hypothetical protein
MLPASSVTPLSLIAWKYNSLPSISISMKA